MTSNYRQELIQVAAVAVAMVEAHDNDSADRTGTVDILGEVLDERVEQNKKWGAQGHSEPVWLCILLEEVGEAITEIAGTAGKLSDLPERHGRLLVSLMQGMQAGASAKQFLERNLGSPFSVIGTGLGN